MNESNQENDTLFISVHDSIFVSTELIIRTVHIEINSDRQSHIHTFSNMILMPTMLPIEKCRQLEPNLKVLPDAVVIEIEENLYQMAQLALEDWVKNKDSLENP